MVTELNVNINSKYSIKSPLTHATWYPDTYMRTPYEILSTNILINLYFGFRSHKKARHKITPSQKKKKREKETEKKKKKQTAQSL